METKKKLVSWVRKMGYDGQIPESLGNICNNSTAFVWEELMQNAKPKEEVDSIRNNIIINRLRTNSLKNQENYSYPIKEIDAFIKCQELKKKLVIIQRRIDEKQQKVQNLSENSKIKYVMIEHLQAKIKENEEREFLLNRKTEILKASYQDAMETLTHCKNLTPVELDENPNPEEVTEILQKCATKLEILLKELPSTGNNYNFSRSSIQPYSSVKKNFKSHTFEKYLNLSEKKTYHGITMLSMSGSVYKSIKDNGKENLAPSKHVIKGLFPMSELTEQTDNNIPEENKERERNTRKDSLGILSESCLTVEGDDSFLRQVNCISPKPTKINKTGAELETETSSKNNFCSLVSIPRIICEEVFDSRGYIFNQFSIQKPMNYNKLYNDMCVNELLQNLLHKHSRQIIWNKIQSLNDNLSIEITNTIFECDKTKKKTSICSDDIAKLQLIHVQKELQIIKQKDIIKHLISKINKQKMLTHKIIEPMRQSDELPSEAQKTFEIKLRNIGLDASLAALKKEIHSSKRFEDNNELAITLDKINKIKEGIASKINLIQEYIGMTEKVLQKISNCRENTFSCVCKLSPFITDMSWAEPLTKNLCSQEISTFDKFPLEYNRRCTFTDSKVFYRDLCGNNISTVNEPNSEAQSMLTEILESPFNPPETIILNIIKSKLKLDLLRRLPMSSRNIIYKRYSYEELQHQENYIQFALDKLNSIIYSASANKTLSTGTTIKNIMEIWLEMPLKDFISPKRMVKDKDFTFYSSLLNSFFENTNQ